MCSEFIREALATNDLQPLTAHYWDDTISRNMLSSTCYDGQGFVLAQKRLSKGRFVWWPKGNGPARALEAYQAQLLVAAGNPDTHAAPMWRSVS
jgi:IS66 Orf2 like protein